jgi:hypothetical protein
MVATMTLAVMIAVTAVSLAEEPSMTVLPDIVHPLPPLPMATFHMASIGAKHNLARCEKPYIRL